MEEHNRDAPKSPHRRRLAEEISQGSLASDDGGRQTTFETRMAMQRELDSARAELRSNERAMDELRRQAAASREEAALYRSDVTRLQGELKSCRERLNSALDGQQDLLAKNSHKQQLLVDMQAQLSSARDELGHQSARGRSLEARLSQTETELRDVSERNATAERTFDEKFNSLSADLSVARERLSTLSIENDTLRATTEALRSDLALTNASLADFESSNRGLREDKLSLESSLRSANDRAARTQDELDTTTRTLKAEITALRAQLAAAESKIAQYRSNEDGLFGRLEAKDKLIGELQSEKSRIQLDLNQTAIDKDAERRALEDELASTKRKEQLLSDDLKQLHRYIGRRELNSTTTTTTVAPSLRTTYRSYSSPLETTTTTYVTRPSSLSSSRRYTTTTYSANPVLDSSVAALNASRRARKISQLAREKADAEALAELARSRLERSIHEDF